MGAVRKECEHKIQITMCSAATVQQSGSARSDRYSMYAPMPSRANGVLQLGGCSSQEGNSNDNQPKLATSRAAPAIRKSMPILSFQPFLAVLA